jgi:hypothetical protein
MSNPSGPDQDAKPEPEETPADDAPQATEEAEQPTEEASPESSAPEEAEETPPEESSSAEPAEPDEPAEPAEPDEPDEPAEPSDPPTEVITPEPQFESAEPTVVLEGAAADAAPEVRYSAPSGFDVKSTEVIQSPPEPATDVMSVPGPTSPAPAQVAAAAVGGQPRPVAPQAIPPRRTAGRHRSWGLVLALILVIAALAAVAVFGTVWLTHSSAPKVSQEDQVRQTIHDFDNAIQRGDLAQLRGITCGTTRDSYLNYDDQQWATTHEQVVAAKRYPMVASIDEVAVNGQHAEANVTTFIAYEPQVRSTRSFDLQFLDGRWKICQGPIG